MPEDLPEVTVPEELPAEQMTEEQPEQPAEGLEAGEEAETGISAEPAFETTKEAEENPDPDEEQENGEETEAEAVPSPDPVQQLMTEETGPATELA